MGREVSRRQLLGQAGFAAAGLAGLGGLGGLAGCTSHKTAATKTLPSAKVVDSSRLVDGYQSFVTRPDLQPPVVDIVRSAPPTRAGYYFLNAPLSGPGRGGGLITDLDGGLVFMQPDTPTAHVIDFNTQILNGKSVLTWFEGVETHGWGQGVAVVANRAYQRKHVIHAHTGPHDEVKLHVDHHEFNITPEGHALISAYRTYSNIDLRPVGGPASGVMVAGVCQEIDIATGKLIFEWDSWQNGVPLEEGNQPFDYNGEKFGIADNPYDYFHINSIAPTADGHLLISSRNTWTIYKVNRTNGKIIWRMNGKKSDFTMGPGSNFYWQHHLRPHPDGIFTVFDNGAAPPKEKQSRALILAVDEQKMHVTLRHHYSHPDQVLLAQAMGSTQLMPDGNVVVGWGTNYYFSEFSQDGTLVAAATMTKHNPSYRVFSHNFYGHPSDPPDVVARHRPGGATIYASWNGATELDSWTVMSGRSRSSVSAVATAKKHGFETAIEVPSAGPYFAVRAHDASGRQLAQSASVRISSHH
ncbi:MAG TPA: arylsulfotransferase family protein [Streptosporangiaceae bacterium]|nr:arylsulfotransferase family protein [Streptosporangiaceae bacterium]